MAARSALWAIAGIAIVLGGATALAAGAGMLGPSFTMMGLGAWGGGMMNGGSSTGGHGAMMGSGSCGGMMAQPNAQMQAHCQSMMTSGTMDPAQCQSMMASGTMDPAQCQAMMGGACH